MDLREARARETIVRHPWELARFEVVNDILLQHFQANQALTILDVGCGDTFFVENLSARFPAANCYGIDIEFKADDLLHFEEKFQGTNIKVFDALENMEQQTPPFSADVVLLLDVIEHIEDDISFLKMLNTKPYITSNTKFFITVPAYQSLYTSHDDFLGHYRRYTNKTLRHSLTTSSHQVLQTGYFFSALLPVRLLKAIKEKTLGKDKESTGLVEWNGSIAKTNTVKNVLLTDYKTSKALSKLGVKLPGLSSFSVSHPKS